MSNKKTEKKEDNRTPFFSKQRQMVLSNLHLFFNETKSSRCCVLSGYRKDKDIAIYLDGVILNSYVIFQVLECRTVALRDEQTKIWGLLRTWGLFHTWGTDVDMEGHDFFT